MYNIMMTIIVSFIIPTYRMTAQTWHVGTIYELVCTANNGKQIWHSLAHFGGNACWQNRTGSSTQRD